MPSEYVIFFEEFKKYQQNEGRTLWIMKPVIFSLILDFEVPRQGHIYIQQN